MEAEPLEKDKIEIAAHEKRKAKSTPINTIQYPEDLPVETTILDLKDEEKIDSKTGQSLVKIGEEVTKKLAVKSSQFFIKQTVRYKYAVKNNPDEGIKTAELSEAILQRCSCDESFLSNIIVKKFCDHLPLSCWVHIRRKFIEAEGSNSESKKNYSISNTKTF